jgi:hypothetical protein
MVEDAMAAAYLKDFREELRRVGEAVFKMRHPFPVLIVIGKTGELVGNPAPSERTIPAARSADGMKQMALADRVFAVTKAAHAPRGPIVLGRSGETDVSIPEYSISKRHCYFDFDGAGIKITDCGSTNGTLIEDRRIPAGEPTLIKDGNTVALGRFAFSFRTAAGFLAYVKSLNA